MILLLDSSASLLRLIVIDDDDVMHESFWQADRQLARGLLSYLSKQLETVGAELKGVTGIGVMKGPGSFTGLRIGITVCNTLADSLEIPIVGQSSSTDWAETALQRLRRGENEVMVMPEYGRPAHITAQKN